MVDQEGLNWWNRIAEASHALYETLSKRGKPSDKEWTHLATFNQYNKDTNNLNVISLATGTKCLGECELDPLGDRISDSHAEVLAKRAFHRYLLLEIRKALEGKSQVFTFNKKKFNLNSNISFHMYTSHTPCGDASIVTKSDLNDVDVGNVIEKDEEPPSKRFKEDIHRTGAKCISGDSLQDSHLPGINYHTLGALRTKPGRGPRTLSLSCSDKLARWIALGIEGGLISTLIDSSIQLKSLTMGLGGPYSGDAIKRALIDRISSNLKVVPSPSFGQATLSFKHGRSEERIKPCPLSIVWLYSSNKNWEVLAEGWRQGVTKKRYHSPSSRSLVCRRELAILCLEIRQSLGLSDINTYEELKNQSTTYLENWVKIKKIAFPHWPSKHKSLKSFYIKV